MKNTLPTVRKFIDNTLKEKRSDKCFPNSF